MASRAPLWMHLPCPLMPFWDMALFAGPWVLKVFFFRCFFVLRFCVLFWMDALFMIFDVILGGFWSRSDLSLTLSESHFGCMFHEIWCRFWSILVFFWCFFQHPMLSDRAFVLHILKQFCWPARFALVSGLMFSIPSVAPKGSWLFAVVSDC